MTLYPLEALPPFATAARVDKSRERAQGLLHRCLGRYAATDPFLLGGGDVPRDDESGQQEEQVDPSGYDSEGHRRREEMAGSDTSHGESDDRPKGEIGAGRTWDEVTREDASSGTPQG